MPVLLSSSTVVRHTVNGERFAGVNICGFSLMKFFMRIFSWCLGQQCFLTIAKYSQENFHGTVKNYENCKSLAQQIFSHLRYMHASKQAGTHAHTHAHTRTHAHAHIHTQHNTHTDSCTCTYTHQ